VSAEDGDKFTADVLVLGGGPAGAWAALTAAATGVRVALADKGWVGSSGAAAAGGNNLWFLPPGPERERSVQQRYEAGGRLAEPAWMRRVVAETYDRLEDLARFGYPFPRDEEGRERRTSLQGPEYMRRMRRRVQRADVTVLDHSPALELLTDDDGAVRGAAGLQRQNGMRPWQVVAGAVVVATGGCAFLSGAYGLDVCTGDGQLMAAELGADLSGMEFSAVYALSAAAGNHTKGLMLQFATYYDAAGVALDVGGPRQARAVVARLIAEGRQVFARLDRMPADLRDAARTAQPNYFLPLDKAGIDPFTQPYPLRLVMEGTVRGTGGLRLVSDACETTVPGLFAAGDAATREYVTGAISGGGSHNGAWAISSGTWAGAGAAHHAVAARRRGMIRPAGTVGLRPVGAAAPVAPVDVVHSVQEELLPPERTLLRTGPALAASVTALDGVWDRARSGLTGSGRDLLRAREAAAVLANARWVQAAALARTESRGLHQRADRPERDAALQHRLLVAGLDHVAVRPEPAVSLGAVS
jgi:succinate dehydrogenase/fumarate reductase flavoprotein subunit